MSRYDDEYEDDAGDVYDDYMDEGEDEDEKPSRASPVRPFSTGISRPASSPGVGSGAPGARPGDASRLPGSPGASRPPSPAPGNPPPGAGRSPLSGGPGSRPGGPPGPPPGSSSFNRPGGPSAPPARPPGSTGPFSGPGSGSPARPGGDSGARRDEGEQSARPRFNNPLDRLAERDDEKRDEPAKPRFGGLMGRSDGDKKDDKPAAPKFGGSGSRPATPQTARPEPKGGGFGGLMGRLSGGDKKDDKRPAPPGSSSAASASGLSSLTARFGGGSADRPATPKGDSGKGGFLGRLRPGGQSSTPPAQPRSPSSTPASGSSPLGSRFGGGSAAPKAASAPRTPRPSLGERLKNFSLLKKPDPKAQRARVSKAPTVRSEGMSLDRKLDIIGVALVLGSLMLIFSSLSPNQGQLTGTVNTFLAQNFGWGAIAVPLAMFAAGIWLILRHFGEDAPVLDIVRVIGVLMLYLGVLVLFQYVDSFSYAILPDGNYLEQLKNIFLPISYTLGHGGGWIGAEIYYFLISNMTEIGGFFVLVAWLVIGLMLTLSLSAAELAIIVISVWRSFSDARHRRAQRRAAMLAEQQANAAPGLPGISVSRPAAEQLPAGRSPALPAPATGSLEAGSRFGERSIPITQGGRTVTASFRPGEPVAVEPEPGPAPRTSPLPFGASRAAEPATGDDAGKRAGLGDVLGGFASRVRQAVPGSSSTTPEAPAAPQPAAGASAPKPALPLGRLSGAMNRVREALPGAQPADKTDAAGKPATPAAPAAAPATPAATERSPYAPPEPETAAPAAASGEDDAVSFASLLDANTPPRPAPPRPAPPRPAPPRPAPPRPTPPSSRASMFDRLAGPSVREEAPATPSPAAPDEKPVEPAAAAGAAPVMPPAPEAPADKGDSRTERETTETPAATLPPRPFERQRPPERPTPFRSPAPPPAPPDEAEDEDDEGEADVLRPARPKGVGPLPRPNLNNPFTRSAPPARTPPAVPDPSRAPMTTLQERLDALRKGATAEPPTSDGEARTGEPAAQADTTPADVKPARPTAEAAREDDEAPAAPAEPAERRQPEPRIVEMDENNQDIETAPAAARPIEPANDRPAAPVASAPASVPPVAAPRAYQLPERPTPPPPPARHAGTTPPSTPPVAARNGGTPSPPASVPRRAKFWELPDYSDLLAQGADQDLNHEQLLQRAKIIEETLASFGAPGRVVEVRTGPVITQFGVEPDYLPGRGGKRIRVKVSAIAQLDKDLQLALGAKSIRIEAPVPGKGYVGIEVPNDQAAIVRLRDILDSPEFQKIKSPLGICLGQGVDGTPVAADLGTMPHLLIAGTTGSGKSVAVNAIIASLLVRNGPDRLKFIMVDPKRVELTGYNGIPHLVAPVVVELERIVSVLKWVTREMDERYKKFSSVGARNIEDYNKHLPHGEQQMPYIIVIIDELADLMMLAPDETERVITRIAALARATGIHLVIATQRPSVDVVTGLIKANFPARIAFAVASGMDSRVILDQPGAERLLGRGDMLYMSGDAPAPVRLQGVFVADTEINNITGFWRAQMGPEDLAAKPLMSSFMAHDSGPASATSGWGGGRNGSHVSTEQVAFWDRELREGAGGFDDDDDGDGEDAMYGEAVELVRRLNKASVSLLQRRLRIGYTRAARLIDIMEERGVVGPPTEGSKPREVLPERD